MNVSRPSIVARVAESKDHAYSLFFSPFRLFCVGRDLFLQSALRCRLVLLHLLSVRLLCSQARRYWKYRATCIFLEENRLLMGSMLAIHKERRLLSSFIHIAVRRSPGSRASIEQFRNANLRVSIKKSCHVPFSVAGDVFAESTPGLMQGKKMKLNMK